MTERLTALAVIAVVGILALILLFQNGVTGRVNTRICPDNTHPVIGGERIFSLFQDFQDAGYFCFFGYDGITPCCARTDRLSQYEYVGQRETWETRVWSG